MDITAAPWPQPEQLEYWGARPEGRRIRITALSLLGLYIAAWVAFAVAVLVEGEPLYAVSAFFVPIILVLAALGWLGSRHPGGAGFFLIFPCAFPIGVLFVGLGTEETWEGETPHLYRDLAFFAGAPAAIGVLFIAAAVVAAWKHRQQRQAGGLEQ